MLEQMPGVSKLQWVSGTQTLPDSAAILAAPQGTKVVTGRDALKLQDILGGSDPTTEAYLRFPGFATVTFQWCDCGFTIADDFSCVQPDQLLRSMAAEYERNGLGTVVGWAQTPRFDAERKVVTYVIRFRNEGHEFEEGDAMIYGRRGYETLLVSSRAGDLASIQRAMSAALRAFSFPPGLRYSDHVASDTTSRNHIAVQFVQKAGAGDDLQILYYNRCRIFASPQAQ